MVALNSFVRLISNKKKKIPLSTTCYLKKRLNPFSRLSRFSRVNRTKRLRLKSLARRLAFVEPRAPLFYARFSRYSARDFEGGLRLKSSVKCKNTVILNFFENLKASFIFGGLRLNELTRLSAKRFVSRNAAWLKSIGAVKRKFKPEFKRPTLITKKLIMR